MRDLLLVGMGGFLGSILRYVMQGGVYRIFPKPYLPWGTLAVNILGCFVIGVLSEWSDIRQGLTPNMRLFLLIGVLGGFTTFSSFGLETVSLWRGSESMPAILNVIFHVVLCLGAVGLGALTSQWIARTS